MGRFSRFVTIGLWIALLAPVIIEISGFRTAHLWSQKVWSREGARRFEDYLIIFAAGSAGFGYFLRRYFLPFLLAAILVCSMIAVGPIPVGAVLLFVFSATVLGRLVFGRSLEGPLAFIAGIAIWILAMTCTVRFPIHYPVTYLAALAVPVAVAYPLSRQLASTWLNLFRPRWLPSNGEFVCFALLALVMVADWLVVLKPEVGTDGLAMHMAIASNIAIHHAFTVDFRQFIWALMPMGADWCYSVVYMLGGEYAARLLNFAVLSAIGLLLFGVARRFVSNAVALLMAFLFLSTPLVQLVTALLLVENFVAAMTFAAAVALWKFYEEGAAQVLILTALLLGSAASIRGPDSTLLPCGAVEESAADPPASLGPRLCARFDDHGRGHPLCVCLLAFGQSDLSFSECQIPFSLCRKRDPGRNLPSAAHLAHSGHAYL